MKLRTNFRYFVGTAETGAETARVAPKFQQPDINESQPRGKMAGNKSCWLARLKIMKPLVPIGDLVLLSRFRT